MSRVSIIVPAYNEALILEKTLVELVAAFPQDEVILVSDGSTDATGDVAARLAPAVTYLTYRPNHGKGYAIRTGMLAAGGDLLVFTDADLPFGVEGVQRVIAELRAPGGCDVAIAEKIRLHRGRAYRAARWGVGLVIRALNGLSMPDTQAGLKGFTRPAARRIFTRTRIDRYAADIEMLYLAQREGLRIVSVPMEVREDPRPSTFNAKQGFYLILDIWRIRFHAYR
jgi:glycosyltransferase involved in cell wall biosynthesis